MAKIVLIAVVVAAVYLLLVKPRRDKVRVRQDAAVLSDAEARDILGVASDADEGEIRSAHRRLLTTLHPDKGGSAELTRRINAARDRLVG